MSRRFQLFPATAPSAPTGARFNTVTILSSDAHTVSEKTTIIGGPASGTITFKVTSYGSADSANSYFNVVGQGNLVLNSTFTLPTDASGNCDYTSITNFNSPHPGGIFITMSITAVSSGSIGNPSTRNYSKTG